MTDWANARRERDEDAWHEAFRRRHPWTPPPPKPPKTPCPECGRVYLSKDELEPHLIDGHGTCAPAVMTRGREWARGRHVVYEVTDPEDWVFSDSVFIEVNGHRCPNEEAREVLASARNTDVVVTLGAPVGTETFEFCFRQAEASDIEGVESQLLLINVGLPWTSEEIRAFIASTERFVTAHDYRNGIAEYLYGLEFRRRQLASESGARMQSGRPYVDVFNGVAEQLKHFDRPIAEAICGLVALHFNGFHTASLKTRSPRVARVTRRLDALTKLDRSSMQAELIGLRNRVEIKDVDSMDYYLTDLYSERLISYLSKPLDGSADGFVAEVEQESQGLLQEDAQKLHLVAAEHCLAIGELDTARRHADALTHSTQFSKWRSQVIAACESSSR